MRSLLTLVCFALPALLALLIYESITSMREYEALLDKQMTDWLQTNNCAPVGKQAGRTVWKCADGATLVH